MASKAALFDMHEGHADVAASITSAGRLDCVTRQDLKRDVAQWDRLAQVAAEPNPFFESWYLLPSLDAYDPRNQIEILRFEAAGKLRGLMPVQRKAGYYGLPLPNLTNWLHANSFFGAPLVERGFEAHFWRALLDWCDGHAGKALFLHISELDLDGPLHIALQGVLSAHGRAGTVVKQEARALLASRLDAESYRATAFSRQKRKDLRRRFNRLSDLGDVRFEWQDGDHAIGKWIDQFLALEASGWKGSAGSALAMDQAKASLFASALKGAATRGRLIRLALMLNGNPIAMLSTFLTPPGAFGYKTAFDEQYGRFAPGILLENEFLATLDKETFAWCDSCAAADHPVMSDIWGERRTIGKISIAIGGRFRRQLFNRILRFEKGRQAAGEHA